MRDKVLLGWFIRVNNNTEKFSPPNLLEDPQFLSTYRLNHFYSSIVCSVNVETCYENCVFCQEKEKWPFWLPKFIMHTLLFSCVLLQQSKFCQVFATKFCEQQKRKQIGRAHEERSAADCRAAAREADLPAISHTRQTSVAPLSPFTFLLTCAHLPASHSHFLTAHNSGTVFLKSFSLNHVFFCLSRCTQYRHCVSQFFSLTHIFFCLSHHGTVWNRLKSQVSCPR